MPKKYHIETKTAAPRFPVVGKFSNVEFREDCAGSCRQCVKKKCVYNVFNDSYQHVITMDEPEFLYICQSCFRCVQECTKGIFSRVINPEYVLMGDEYWQPEIIDQTWFQAHTGRIPVSGAGYRGKFSGTGFDAMWTDMSEIVRPTRDGIHGREYICTSIELSRKPMRLTFDEKGELPKSMPEIVEIPIPVLLQPPTFGVLSEKELVAMAAAAHKLHTMMLIDAKDYSPAFSGFNGTIVPRVTATNYKEYVDIICKSRMVELSYSPGIEREFAKLRSFKPGLLISVGLPLDASVATRALELTAAGVDVLHFYADDDGREMAAANLRTLRDMIREIHRKLVEAKVRPTVNLLFSGGIAMAEHMAKAIICGADGVVVDIPLLIALECRLCGRCKRGESCPVNIGDIDIAWGTQRIVNLIGAWHNQLLEVMGACGIREVRRLRGEAGRALFLEDLERESFAPIFGQRKVSCG
jgi:ferredoxin